MDNIQLQVTEASKIPNTPLRELAFCPHGQKKKRITEEKRESREKNKNVRGKPFRFLLTAASVSLQGSFQSSTPLKVMDAIKSIPLDR